jgi:hypothetical protein
LPTNPYQPAVQPIREIYLHQRSFDIRPLRASEATFRSCYCQFVTRAIEAHHIGAIRFTRGMLKKALPSGHSMPASMPTTPEGPTHKPATRGHAGSRTRNATHFAELHAYRPTRKAGHGHAVSRRLRIILTRAHCRDHHK